MNEEKQKLQLEEAGITVSELFGLRGYLHNWSFNRGRSYWIATGPGIPLGKAIELQNSHGRVVRAEGDCLRRGPLFWNKGFGTGMYHVDTFEGLKALVDMLNEIVEEAEALKGIGGS